MRLRLVHTLSALMLSFACLAVLALGGLTAWNLRKGFGEYLASRDVVLLERLVTAIEKAVAQPGGLQALREGRLPLRPLLDELARQGGDPLPAGQPQPFDDRPPFERGDPPPGFPDRGPPPPFGSRPPPGAFDDFPQRISLVDPEGRMLAGRASAASEAAVVDRPVRLNGELVARARLRPATTVPEGPDAHFLREQYTGIVAASVALIALALISAAWLARRWARPLVAVQHATQRLARGEFELRLKPGTDFGERSDEIGDVVRNINAMAEGLQRLEGARRRWLADISHELRTPLTVLRGDIEALVDGVRPLRPQAIAGLRDEVLRLGQLIDDLHLLAMSDLQALPCHVAPADAALLMQGLQRRFSGRAEAAGIRLELLPLAGDVGAVVWDAARIDQMLGNLVDNSLRYTDAPGRVQIAARREGRQLLIDIDDSAPGVAATDLPRLFEPLFRTDPARSRQRGGSGLGLAICQAIAAAHGGSIRALASGLGGLRIHVELPMDAGGPSKGTL